MADSSSVATAVGKAMAFSASSEGMSEACIDDVKVVNAILAGRPMIT